MSEICDNCGATVPKCVRVNGDKLVCCVHCEFSPLGCRCRFGEFGVAETYWWDDYDWDDTMDADDSRGFEDEYDYLDEQEL